MVSVEKNPVKDPVKVAQGKAGMRARWGPPRRARLDALSPEQRAIVLALIAAAEAARERETAKPPGQAA